MNHQENNLWHFLDFAGDFSGHFENCGHFEFSVVNSDVLTLRNIKVHKLHVQINGKIRNILTFLDFGCHFENGGHFEIFCAKFGLGDVRKR